MKGAKYTPFAKRFLPTIREKTLGLILASEFQWILRTGLPHMGAPEGFRSISMSQAI